MAGSADTNPSDPPKNTGKKYMTNTRLLVNDIRNLQPNDIETILVEEGDSDDSLPERTPDVDYEQGEVLQEEVLQEEVLQEVQEPQQSESVHEIEQSVPEEILLAEPQTVIEIEKPPPPPVVGTCEETSDIFDKLLNTMAVAVPAFVQFITETEYDNQCQKCSPDTGEASNTSHVHGLFRLMSMPAFFDFLTESSNLCPDKCKEEDAVKRSCSAPSFSTPEAERDPAPVPAIETEPELIPVVETEPDPIPVVETESEAMRTAETELMPDVETEPESIPAVETETEPIPAVETEPEPIPAVETETEPIPAVETEPEPIPAVETETEPIPAVDTDPELMPDVETEPIPTADTEPEPTPAVEMEPEPMSTFEQETETASVIVSEPEADPLPNLEADSEPISDVDAEEPLIENEEDVVPEDLEFPQYDDPLSLLRSMTDETGDEEEE